jgi:hydrogenase expression/formation protein HypD
MSTSLPPTLQVALRDANVAQSLVQAIHREAAALGVVRLMEICGTHTMAIRRAGIPALLPKNIILLSGPGCPVCVTPNAVIDRAVALARLPGVIIATFGDMLRVPGSSTSLTRERGKGADVRVVYSPLDALTIAKSEPTREVIFLGVGFETTAPTVASAVDEALGKLPNFSILCAHKLVPPALEALLALPGFTVNGFLCPGHVSAIIGANAYIPIATQHRIPCVVAGFEPGDILLSIVMLLRQIREGRNTVEVEYKAVVRPEGNVNAQKLLAKVFNPAESTWRGVGTIKDSGLVLALAYRALDAEERFTVAVEPEREHPGCLCGKVLIGAVRPPECSLFGRVCTPANPVGPCMVSTEGTCAAYYRYELKKL